MEECRVCGYSFRTEISFCPNCGCTVDRPAYPNENRPISFQDQVPDQKLTTFEWYIHQQESLSGVDDEYLRLKLYFETINDDYVVQQHRVDTLKMELEAINLRLQQLNRISLPSLITTLQGNRKITIEQLERDALELKQALITDTEILEQIVDQSQQIDKELNRLHKLIQKREEFEEKLGEIVLSIDLDHPREDYLEEQISNLNDQLDPVKTNYILTQSQLGLLKASLQHYQQARQHLLETDHIIRYNSDFISKLLMKSIRKAELKFKDGIDLSPEYRPLQEAFNQLPTKFLHTNFYLTRRSQENDVKYINRVEESLNEIIIHVENVIDQTKHIFFIIEGEYDHLVQEIEKRKKELIDIRIGLLTHRDP